jgi:broad specificity phosphatase PhoE
VNRYGAVAMRYWVQWLPTAYAGISDPDAFFTELGEEVAGQVEELAERLAGEDRPGEGYLAPLSRLFTARAVAEEIIVPQRVKPEPEAGEEP